LGAIIGIRREDKNEWEARVPLIPDDLAELRDRHGVRFLVQPSPIRAYQDAAYRDAGIEIAEDLGPAGVIIAVKEIPTALLRAGKTYVYFAHVIKGQPHNMEMLQRLLELGCSLVDYERIVDSRNRRLIFFGVHAGYAGMIETLWSLSGRYAALGLPDPFADVRHAYEYEGLDAAKSHLREIGRRIARDGLDERLSPLVFGVAGYGNVSRGAQEILDCLPVAEVDPEALPSAAARGGSPPAPLLKAVFKEEHMVRPVEPGVPFALNDYYEHPERYSADFERHLGHLDVLVNTIYWDERYPRLVTRDWARRTHGAGSGGRLQVIGDISCDIEGSIEMTLKATMPDEPCFTYDPATDEVRMGCEGPGPVVMAVDNLPCELPRESSQHFSASLRSMVPALAAADWTADLESLQLPPELKTALIVHRGELTPDYRHLQEYLRN
jgi:alpha-aminoadipic semialdehyde synthase